MAIWFILGTWLVLALALSILLGAYLADYVWRIISAPMRFLFIAVFSTLSWMSLVVLGLLIIWP